MYVSKVLYFLEAFDSVNLAIRLISQNTMILNVKRVLKALQKKNIVTNPSFGTTTLCGFSPSQSDLSKFFYP